MEAPTVASAVTTAIATATRVRQEGPADPPSASLGASSLTVRVWQQSSDLDFAVVVLLASAMVPPSADRPISNKMDGIRRWRSMRQFRFWCARTCWEWPGPWWETQGLDHRVAKGLRSWLRSICC